MKKDEIFTFTAPNGVEVTAVVLDCLGIINYEEVPDSKHWGEKYLCYGKNRIFYYTEWIRLDRIIDDDFIPGDEMENDWYYAIKYHSHEVKTTENSQKILAEYCVIPEYDELLEEYQRDSVMEQISTHQSWEEELGREIQSCNNK